MKSAGSHFHIVGLQDDAALIGPEPLQGQDESLERAFRAHVRGDGIHRQIRLRWGFAGARDRIGGGTDNQGNVASGSTVRGALKMFPMTDR